jgi:proteasome beta subunit
VLPKEVIDKQELYEKLKKGTTTLGVVCRDGVVLATDRRATAGTYIAHRKARKLFVLDDNKAATIAGLVADAQMVMDWLKSQVALAKMNSKTPMTVKMLATFTSNVLMNSKWYPYIVQFIMAGVDETGPRMFVMDWFGTLTEEKLVSTGSGSPYAIAVLESALKKSPTVNEALPTIVKAVKTAMERDPGSGEGIDIMIICKDGIRELSEQEIAKLLD